MFGQGQLICTLPHQNSWNGMFLDSMGLNKSLDFCKNIRLIIRLKRNIRIDYSFSYKGDPNSQIHYSVWYKRNPNNSNSIRFIPKGIIRFLINSYSAELFVFVWALDTMYTLLYRVFSLILTRRGAGGKMAHRE